ncbi:hypothetical protein BT96DRAFT_871622 [Gymnopus androsaceus JB14]|uniref:DUF6534 domain-containing protein n=1 Tax=Gymnopus androsaceus JB14 TaxID=1447944 RepID=A0A6A4IP58_9AGAR|nr:hypothetical protein BT96DRAFT_871622 [Gymnopus androsaceus JB14]
MPSLIPLDSSLGALFIGIILSTAVYGVTCLQAYNYFMHHSFNDRWFLKLFVIVLWVVDTLHVALLAIFYYGYTVTNFGDYEFLAKVYWPLTIQVLIGDIITVAIHMFFACRIYLLSGKKLVIPSAICLIDLAQFCECFKRPRVFLNVHVMDLALATAKNCNLLLNCPQFLNLGLLPISIGMTDDTIVTASMIYYLRKSRSSFKQTNHIVNTLVTYTINTGLLTTIFTLACLLLLSIQDSPTSLIFALFFFIEVRLYTCSFMSVLNSRTALRERRDHSIIVSTLHSSESHSNGNDRSAIQLSTMQSASAGPKEGVLVTKTREVAFDLEQARTDD